MHPNLSALIPLADEVHNYFSQAKVDLAQLPPPDLIFICGCHEFHTLEATCAYLESLDVRPTVIISGGTGRGTKLLRKAVLESFPNLGPLDDLCEAEIYDRLMKHWGLDRPAHLEQCSTHCLGNFECSLKQFPEIFDWQSGLGVMAIMQSSINRRRTLIAASSVLAQSSITPVTVSFGQFDWFSASEDQLVTTLFRLVGLQGPAIARATGKASFDPKSGALRRCGSALPVEGEMRIWNEYMMGFGQTIPDCVKDAYEQVEFEFSCLLASSPDLFQHIACFFDDP